MGLFSLFPDGFMFISVNITPDAVIFSSILTPQMPIFAPSSPYQTARSLRGVCEETTRSMRGAASIFGFSSQTERKLNVICKAEERRKLEKYKI